MFFYHSGAIVTIGHLLSAQFTAIGPSILREFVGIVPRSSLRASHFWAAVACVTQKAVLYFGFGFHQNTSHTSLRPRSDFYRAVFSDATRERKHSTLTKPTRRLCQYRREFKEYVQRLGKR